MNPVYGYLERLAGWFTDFIVAVSQSEREGLQARRIVAPRQVVHVTAGIDTAAYAGYTAPANLREELGLPPSAVVVGSAGRLVSHKDPFTFLNVAKIVTRARSDTQFVWIGDGELREEMTERTRQAGLTDRVKLAGYNPDLRPWMATLDIFMLTSLSESFGYVTCEAMAMAKPVVGTRVPGTSELVDHGKTGLLAPFRDETALAEGVLRLVDDQNMRIRMGRQGRHRAEKLYDLSRMVHDLEEFYWQLLKRRYPGSRDE
jgi:glycosyltransferase involved in cell wall biosynthesis